MGIKIARYYNSRNASLFIITGLKKNIQLSRCIYRQEFELIVEIFLPIAVYSFALIWHITAFSDIDISAVWLYNDNVVKEICY